MPTYCDAAAVAARLLLNLLTSGPCGPERRDHAKSIDCRQFRRRARSVGTARLGGQLSRRQHRKERARCQWRHDDDGIVARSEEHTSELQSPDHLVCRLLLEKKKILNYYPQYSRTRQPNIYSQ